MKKQFLAVCCILISISCVAQIDSTQPGYKRFPAFPPVKLLLPDSTSYFTKKDLAKKSQVMVMVFNPQCEHCQHEAEGIIQHIEEFKDIQIIMATMMPFDSMMSFRSKYKLDQFSNITVAQDFQYFLSTFYRLSTLPFLAFYNSKKELISTHDGALPVERVLDIFKENKD
jgi:hypothetical protein